MSLTPDTPPGGAAGAADTKDTKSAKTNAGLVEPSSTSPAAAGARTDTPAAPAVVAGVAPPAQVSAHADVVAPGGALDNGLWLSVSALAKRKGITKQTLSERVKKLVAAGLIETKPGANRAVLVNLAQFDRAVGEAGDPVKETAAATRAEDAGGVAASDPRYRDAKASDAHYAAELKRLDLEERIGKLVKVDDVRDAIEAAARIVVAVIERLPQRAAEVAAAVGQDGEMGARRVLKGAAFELRKAIAEALTVHGAAPEAPAAE